jgi:hypothetical protein
MYTCTFKEKLCRLLKKQEAPVIEYVDLDIHIGIHNSRYTNYPNRTIDMHNRILVSRNIMGLFSCNLF